MSQKTIVKSVESEYDENTIYGVNHVRRVQEWSISEIEDYPREGETFVQCVETVRQNGIITFSAAYPYNSEYAKNRIGDEWKGAI